LSSSILRLAHRLLRVSCFLVLTTAVVAGESAPQARVDRPQARPTGTLTELQSQAAACEKRGDWIEACRCYDEIARRDRSRADARASYLRCLRHHHLVRRHQDPVYHQALTRLTPAQALDVYDQVLTAIASKYLDRRKTQWTLLFQCGVKELQLALEEPLFLREYLSDVTTDTVASFAQRLDECRDRKVGSRSDARLQVLGVLEAAQQVGIPLRPVLMTALTLEFASGACNALDEWTLFVTPGSAGEGSRSRLPSIGVEVAVVQGQVVITRVYPNSPASEAGLMPQDRVVRIGTEAIDNLTADAVAERLRGDEGTVVDIEVLGHGQTASRIVALTRRVVLIPSVESGVLPLQAGEIAPDAARIGVLRITSFQDNTLQEVKEALASLQSEPAVKALILDLRGNPGGLFEVAVQVAELFLGEGVVVIAQGPHRKFNKPYRAEISNPVTLPLVVLVDSDTASAAEVVAGALKEHRRATLVGETTYGKGSVQVTILLDKPPLDRMPAAIRVTVARLLSPTRQPYTGLGITPDVPFATADNVLFPEARRLLLGLLRPMPPMSEMEPGDGPS
jgi:carboxyl-terminal processing protease